MLFDKCLSVISEQLLGALYDNENLRMLAVVGDKLWELSKRPFIVESGALATAKYVEAVMPLTRRFQCSEFNQPGK